MSCNLRYIPFPVNKITSYKFTLSFSERGQVFHKWFSVGWVGIGIVRYYTWAKYAWITRIFTYKQFDENKYLHHNQGNFYHLSLVNTPAKTYNAECRIKVMVGMIECSRSFSWICPFRHNVLMFFWGGKPCPHTQVVLEVGRQMRLLSIVCSFQLGQADRFAYKLVNLVQDVFITVVYFVLNCSFCHEIFI